MGVVYTRHAKGRMRWREISKDEVERVLKAPTQKEMIGFNKYHLFRQVGTRYLRITCVIEETKYIVISAVDKGD